MLQLLIVLLSGSYVVLTTSALPTDQQLLVEQRPTYYEVSPTGSTLAQIVSLKNGSKVQQEVESQRDGDQAKTIDNTLTEHHVLPAEVLQLPITISTRQGVRTVIAPETITLREHGVAKIGDIVQKIPTAVSHQRQTVVHKHANVLTAIVAPAVRTYSAQVLRSYHTPLLLQPITSITYE